MWAEQISQLREVADTLVPQLGSGTSVELMAGYILSNAPPRFALAAHGMGGFLAFEMWRQSSGRIERLALLDTNAMTDSAQQTVRRQLYADLVMRGEFARVIEERIPILLHEERQNDAALVAKVRAMATETGAPAFLRQQQAIMARPDSRPTLRTISCPTLVVNGRQDRITSLEDAMLISEQIPGARLEIVEHSGHLVPMEQPNVLAELMKKWLRG